MIEMNMDCAPYLEELADFLGYGYRSILRFYNSVPSHPRWGGGTVEPAVAQMLYIVVRAVEPRSSLEFGTNVGYSTYFMASALRDNTQDCVLHTWDIDRNHISEAIRRIGNLNLENYVLFHKGDTTESVEPFLRSEIVQPDLVFIDSSHQYEATKIEIGIILKFMSKGIIMFHDALSPESGVTQALDEISEEGRYDMLRIPTQPNTGFGIMKVG